MLMSSMVVQRLGHRFSQSSVGTAVAYKYGTQYRRDAMNKSGHQKPKKTHSQIAFVIAYCFWGL
jgi:hypothetical protein